jgi:hypothetical protein
VVVVHDYLARLVGKELVDDILTAGGRHYAPSAAEVYVPVEFADAAYRYGHSQIRHEYRLRAGRRARLLFPDLMGFGPVPADHRLDLEQIFDFPQRPPAQRAKKIDGSLSQSLIALPRQVTGEVIDRAYESLAVRDLLRGAATGLPSGEAVAAALGAPTLTVEQIGPDWQGGTPLWLYALKEAGCLGDGTGLAR